MLSQLDDLHARSGGETMKAAFSQNAESARGMRRIAPCCNEIARVDRDTRDTRSRLTAESASSLLSKPARKPAGQARHQGCRIRLLSIVSDGVGRLASRATRA